MDPADKSPTIVVEDTAESLDELSEYLDVLSSSARLRIVKFLEKKPRDARAISHEIETSYENTKKHLDKLMSIGVIKKEAGLGAPTSKGIHPVWQYSVVPGGLESIIRNLGLFSNTRVQIIGGRSQGGWNRSRARSLRKCWETCLLPSSLADMTMVEPFF